MDSITQFALGAAIGVAVMRKRTPVWKSALIGGMIGTLPDLDAFIDHGDPIRNMTYHRGESHSIFYQTLISPLVAWLITRLKSQRDHFKPWLLAVWLGLTTHALLDLMTVYGTQIGLPFFTGSYGVSSIFIIDPLYTFPLLIGLIGTGIAKGENRFRWNSVGLTLSCFYLLWTVGAQSHVRTLAAESLAAQNIPATKILVTPTPFNTILWRVVATTDDGYAEGFYSLLAPEPQVTFKTYPQTRALYDEWKEDWYVKRMEWFTNGFIRVQIIDGKPVLSDLRMGQEPFYSFNFILSHDAAPEHYRARPDIGKALEWVQQRARGNPQSLEDFLRTEVPVTPAP